MKKWCYAFFLILRYQGNKLKLSRIEWSNDHSISVLSSFDICEKSGQFYFDSVKGCINKAS